MKLQSAMMLNILFGRTTRKGCNYNWLVQGKYIAAERLCIHILSISTNRSNAQHQVKYSNAV